MKEHNQASLRKALGQLPQYQAPENAWEQLESALEETETQAEVSRPSLQRALGNLTSYRAPERLWGRIEGNMQRNRWMRTGLRYGLAAGVMLLLLGSGIWLWLRQSQTNNPVEISEKRVEDPLRLTQPEIAAYETQIEDDFRGLQACLESLSEQEKQSHTTSLATLDSVIHSQEIILQSFQDSGTPSALASAQFERLENRRSELIRELRSSLCPEE